LSRTATETEKHWLSLAEETRFAHDSERRFARILDFYGVVWEYEPVEFALGWDEQGRPTSGFRPDFWLPAQRLFVELTTMNQPLVTKKNGKVRRLRELYPEIRVKVLYQRDTLALLAKYGLVGDGLGVSGSDDIARPA
jgi:hypoxanthine phosphoribosyltransferase